MIVHPKFRDHLLETSGGGTVGFYERTFHPLSNFSSYAVEWPPKNGEYADWHPTTLWPTSEHAYQAARFMHTAPELAEEILLARSAHIARGIAMKNKERQRPDWDDIKARVMYSICNAKLLQHDYVEICLERTGDAEIVEDSPTDDFWGWGPANENGEHHGRNMLGKIWMELREDLRDGTIYPR